MQDKKRSQEEAEIKDPTLQTYWFHRYRQCSTCKAWKLVPDGETHMIYQGIGQWGWVYEFHWICKDCWSKDPNNKEPKKDKDADKDEDKDEANDEGNGPSKKKKHVTFQPWEDSPPEEVDG